MKERNREISLKLAELYVQMLLIRRFEERLLILFDEGKCSGTIHTYIGQEANAVGIINHLNQADAIFSNHRSHGHYLTWTNDAYGLACEILGKADGVCNGIGGSQHLFKKGFLSSGVQGSIVPVAAGVALAKKLNNAHIVLF